MFIRKQVIDLSSPKYAKQNKYKRVYYLRTWWTS